jgi:replicative DNA helicase
MSDTFALPSASPDAERMVISCMMQDPANHVGKVMEHLGEEAFRGPGHRTIAAAIFARFSQHQGCDLLSIQQELVDKNLLDAAGGSAYLTDVAVSAPTVHEFARDFAEVRRKAYLKGIWHVCHDVMATATATDDQGNPEGILDAAEMGFHRLRENFKAADDQLKHAKEHISAAIDQFEAAYKHRNTGIIGVPTGFVDLDRMLNGLKGGQLVVLAARPSVGKSALMMNILQYAAGTGVGCALFSLEMSGMEMAQRMICSTANVSLQRVRDGFLSKADFPRITSAGGSISAQNVWIDERPAITLYALRAAARRLKFTQKIGFICIDYLQLMRAPSKRNDANRALEISEITGGLKELAKELDLPILALAQLNREAERRGEPKLSDLRESGSIEQDADIVLLMNRDKENPDEPTKLYVAKQRNGPVGCIDLTFDGERTKFRDCTEKRYSNNPEERQKGYSKK